MIDVDCVVWDFDGVLNANIVDGRFIWSDHLERDTTSRDAYIENEMGFGNRVERILASGQLRCLKPEVEFFRRVTDELGVVPDRVILIDDSPRNLRAARDLGWSTHYFAGDYKALKARLGLG